MPAKLPEAPRPLWRPPTPHEIEQAQVLREGRMTRARQAMDRRQRDAEELARVRAADAAEQARVGAVVHK